MEVGGLLVIALDGLGRELLVNVLPEKLREELPQCCWRFRSYACAGLCKFQPLLFLNAADGFCVLGFTFSWEIQTQKCDDDRSALSRAG